MAAAGIELSDEALQDLEGAVDYLWDASRRTARDFAEAYRSAVLQLRQFPGTGVAIDGGFRSIPVPRMPYRLVYRLNEGFVRIVAVAHTSREPGYWRDRL